MTFEIFIFNYLEFDNLIILNNINDKIFLDLLNKYEHLMLKTNTPLAVIQNKNLLRDVHYFIYQNSSR